MKRIIVWIARDKIDCSIYNHRPEMTASGLYCSALPPGLTFMKVEANGLRVGEMRRGHIVIDPRKTTPKKEAS